MFLGGTCGSQNHTETARLVLTLFPVAMFNETLHDCDDQ